MAEQYYMVVDEQSTGPYTLEALKQHPKLRPESLVWKPGIENWIAARDMPELDVVFNAAPPYPRYGNQPPRYEQPANRYQGYHTNWLPWAIVATILGFLTSCVGAIFGIIGIVQANKANNLYSQGLEREGDATNSNAKIMTIIGLIFAGIGVVINIFFFRSVIALLSSLGGYY